jgi:hypothetical protein
VKNQLVALFLCFALSVPAFAVDPSYKIAYAGGSLPDIKVGAKLTMSVNGDEVKFFDAGKLIATMPASAITEISYGQDVHRRVGSAVAVGVFTLGVGALMALTKSKKHFIGITWANGEQKGGLALQADKNEYRGLLAGLEGVTGKKAVNSDTMTVKN